jgi:hypothetical protein
VPQIKISDVNCALWFMKACSSLGGYQSFWGTYSLSLLGELFSQHLYCCNSLRFM